MPLDHQSQKLLDATKASGLPPFNWLPYQEARKRIDKAFIIHDTPVEVRKVEDIEIPCPRGGIVARIYTPAGEGPFPVVVFFHGGGWCLFNLETHDSICRHLTKQSECIFVSVDYRMAPEAKFPGPVDDAYSATEWVYDNAVRFNGDPNRLAVAGDSSGGNLAAVVAQLSRDRNGPPIRLQVLIYPVTDYIFPGTPSYEEVGTGYSLDRDKMMWYWNHYHKPGEDVNNPYICPMRAKSLADLPPAVIVTAEYDPLRDEGELYAKRLIEAGVDTTLTRYDGVMHGFVGQWRVLDKGMDALRKTGSDIKERLYAL